MKAEIEPFDNYFVAARDVEKEVLEENPPLLPDSGDITSSSSTMYFPKRMSGRRFKECSP